ncbi:GNAT family N-acetyltransferase [Clostridium paridis]|uniref:GNAT family N-acetyltransferase n=1 Tax=Clostridium paridis TaxID=2803863 RepID=A0A937K4M3_9CLOT|nr:GNAT family N-acetyltransferase [Clostridium paridis]MBL4931678.1 GNAT family N-acetyltransferase [Clostridium paridis]
MEERGSLIKELDIKDYEAIYRIWNRIPGIGLSDADSKQSISSYLARNPNLSYVYLIDGRIVGTILCGHDGRRGYIHHACVLPKYQGKGIGKILVNKALDELKKQGINKCHLFALGDNELGKEFWSKVGWTKRNDIVTFSKNI